LLCAPITEQKSKKIKKKKLANGPDQILATKMMNDEIDALKKAWEFTTVINHPTQLFEKLKRIHTMSNVNINVAGIVTDAITRWWSTTFFSIECSG
jgi:hypothetical protein